MILAHPNSRLLIRWGRSFLLDLDSWLLMHYLYNTILSSFPKLLKVVVNPCFSFLTPYEPASTGQNAVSTDASHFTIRTAQVGDLSTLAEILTDSFHPRTGLVRWAYPMLRLGIYEDLRNRLRSNSPYYACFVATVDGASVTEADDLLAGTVELALRSPHSFSMSTSQYPYISNLAVRKSCRRRGVAQQLLLECERTSLEWGFQDIYLHVLENNHEARQLYLKAGYQLRQVEPSCSAWLFGRPKRLFLHKRLAPTRTR